MQNKPESDKILDCQDITEQKRLVEELAFQAWLLDSVHDAICAMDDNYVVTYWNKIAEKLFGYSAEEVLGKASPVQSSISEISRNQEFAKMINNGFYVGEEIFHHKNGTPIYLDFRVRVRIDNQGAFKGYVASFRDITRQKQVEKDLQESQKKALELAEKLNRADSNKNEFISVLSHELRNPLTSIMMGITVLDQVSPGPEEARQAHEIINRQTNHLSRLVDDLLEVTRITQNKIQLKKEHIELNQLVGQVVQDYRLQFAEKIVGLEAQLNAEPIYLEADPARLTQVVGNLLANASKFTGSGGNTLLTVRKDQNNKEAVIVIKDTGLGIDPSLLSDLFEPFMQADNSLDRSHSGLGMGLSIVKGMVILHGGSVAAFSEGLGKGAKFIIRLPLATPEVQNSPEQEESIREKQLPAMRILAIDDMPTITNLLSILLKHLGHEVIIANNGPEGIAKARELKPEVVLCDIGMPGMDGYEVAREIRSDNRLKNVFLIALSGYAQPEDLKSSMDAGFDRHLAKPVRMAVLKATLAEYYDEK